MADNSEFHSAGEEQPEVAEHAVQQEGNEQAAKDLADEKAWNSNFQLHLQCEL